MESGLSSIIPLIPRKTAYPFKNTIIKFKRIIPKNKMIFMKTQTKTEIISMRVTPEQREIIEEKAYSSYRTPSMYLRDCALDKKIIVVKGVDEVANELRKIGNNLNQLTRAVNSGYVREVDLTATREEVAKIWQSLNSLRQDVR